MDKEKVAPEYSTGYVMLGCRAIIDDIGHHATRALCPPKP